MIKHANILVAVIVPAKVLKAQFCDTVFIALYPIEWLFDSLFNHRDYDSPYGSSVSHSQRVHI